jgi:hypothetical protein
MAIQLKIPIILPKIKPFKILQAYQILLLFNYKMNTKKLIRSINNYRELKYKNKLMHFKQK